MVLTVLDIKDIPKKYIDKFTTHGETIYIDTQKTGFGKKQFMLCPYCGERRAELYYHNNKFCCRSCIGVNIYSYRTNIYDEGGERLILYYILKIAKKLNLKYKDLKFPIRAEDFLFLKPKYMRWEKFAITLKQLTILETMRSKNIFLGYTYSARDIKANLNKEFLKDMDIETVRW